jgi:hypothetical protein
LVGFYDVFCFDWPTKDAAELTGGGQRVRVGHQRRPRLGRDAACELRRERVAAVVEADDAATAGGARLEELDDDAPVSLEVRHRSCGGGGGQSGRAGAAGRRRRRSGVEQELAQRAPQGRARAGGPLGSDASALANVIESSARDVQRG